jgi:serine/threonine-protein kinase/endoribonuclease IRE1
MLHNTTLVWGFITTLLVFFVAAAHNPNYQASPSPSQTPSPAQQALAVGLPRSVRRRASASSIPLPPAPHPPILAPPEGDFDIDVLPFALVSTIDGALHAIDRETGEVKWTLRDGVEPLVGGGIYGRQDDVEYIVEPLSGSLYVFEGENAGPKGMPKVRKLPYSVEQL